MHMCVHVGMYVCMYSSTQTHTHTASVGHCAPAAFRAAASMSISPVSLFPCVLYLYFCVSVAVVHVCTKG